MNEYAHRILQALLACLLVAGVLRAQVPAQDAAQEENEESVAGVTARGGTVTANLLRVRSRPATHYEVIAHFKQGDRVQVVGENEEWYRVLVPAEARAYVAVRYIGPDGAITGDQVRVHSGPGLAFNPYGFVNKGDKIKALGAPESDWQKIEPPAGAAAWVNKAFVKLDPPPAPPVAEKPVAETVNATGKEPEAAKPGAEAAPKEPEVARVEAPAPKAEKAVETAPVQTGAGAQPAVAAAGETKDATALVPPVKAESEPPAKPSNVAAGTGAVAQSVPPFPLPVAQGRPFGRSGQLLREGVIVALPPGSRQVVTHFLGIRILSTTYPVCYLRSSRVNLAEWEYREVRVYGTDVQYPNWSKPVMDVRSIHLFASPSGGAGTALP